MGLAQGPRPTASAWTLLICLKWEELEERRRWGIWVCDVRDREEGVGAGGRGVKLVV